MAEGDVGQVHREAALVDERGELLLVQLTEADKYLDFLGHCELERQRVALLERCLACLHGVDDVVLHGLQAGFAQAAFQHVHLSAGDLGPLALADELDALAGTGGTLVELSGKELHGEDLGRLGEGRQFKEGVVGLGFAEDGGHAPLKELL